MTRLRRDTQDTLTPNVHFQRHLRIIASGTFFLTHTLTLPSHPEPSSVVRARSVSRSRGGSASTCLSILAQFPSVDAMLVAPLGGNEEGQMIIRDLELERVSTRYCKIWENAGVPSAWVLHADDTDSKAVINNNPLPDVTHEEFVSLIGPVLVPENYAYLNTPSSNPSSPPALQAPSNSQPRPSFSNPTPRPPPNPAANPNSPAPLDWVHFEGRSVKTTLSNLVGLDGLAREKKWRSHCVFSVDVGRRARQGVEALRHPFHLAGIPSTSFQSFPPGQLLPHADVIFLNKHYALAHSPAYASSPRAFLLSLIHLAPPHSLLVAHWGTEGGAVLSVPTREYFQSSGWVEPTPVNTEPISPTEPPAPDRAAVTAAGMAARAAGVTEVESVRSGSGFWAGGHHTESSSEFTATGLQLLQNSGSDHSHTRNQHPQINHPQQFPQTLPNATIPRRIPQRRVRHRRTQGEEDDDDSSSSGDSEGTQIANGGRGSNGSRNSAPNQNQSRPATAQQQQPPRSSSATSPPSNVIDEVGASDAFIAGMMYALTRRMLPGEPYTPSAIRKEKDKDGTKNAGVSMGNSLADVALGMRWRLEECLRFATELAGRKARRKDWDGLAEEMARAGWFE